MFIYGVFILFYMNYNNSFIEEKKCKSCPEEQKSSQISQKNGISTILLIYYILSTIVWILEIN